MKTRQIAKISGSIAAVAAIVLGLSSISLVQAETEESLSRKGLKIAPVPLNMAAKNADLVGYGSYLVNAVSDCNGCHSAGPQTAFAAGGNPFFGQSPAKVNPATYLGGGRDFG